MRTDIQSALAKHPGLLHRARFVKMRFDILSSAKRLRVQVDGPSISAFVVHPGLGESAAGQADFSIAADDAAWQEFSKPVNQPGYHDLMALLGAGNAQFDGDALPFYTHLFLVRGIVNAVFRPEADLW